MPSRIFYVLFVLFLISACSNPFANQQLSMTADPGVTEAWLSLHVDGAKGGADYIVQRDGTTIFKGRLQSPDTVVYDSLLAPATTYTYRFYARENGDNSPALQNTLTTLDTTSHNFSWQIYEFGGQKGSSSFYDVAIIDENDIWAVGEIYTEDTYTYDSLGNFLQPYNAAHWDGQKWELKRIDWDGNVSKLTCVFAFSSEDVWFGVTNLIHWNGHIFEKNWNPVLNQFTDKTVNKIWGTSSSDLYVVGNGGLIAHYDGSSWTKIESGTDLPIQDIWGGVDPDGNREVICLASDYFNSYDRKLFMLNNNAIKEITSSYTPGTVKALWFVPREKYLMGGGWLFYRNEKKSNWKQDWLGINHAYIFSIAGSGLNDIITCGAFGEIMHFNGKSWHNYYETTKISGNYYSIKTYQNTAVAVGENIHSGNIDTKARVLVGQH